ncbi:MAG: hypothetical protein ACYCPP_03120 [Nitrososphaerales archaeon]
MSKKGRVPLRLDIVGLIPDKFQACLENAHSLVESRTKGSVSEMQPAQGIAGVDQTYTKIAMIALDFQRAYGRAVEVRVFEKSPNKFFEKVLKMRNSGEQNAPVFFVNGVRIFRGVPNSFSELDEAIENAFGKSR